MVNILIAPQFLHTYRLSTYRKKFFFRCDGPMILKNFIYLPKFVLHTSICLGFDSCDVILYIRWCIKGNFFTEVETKKTIKAIMLSFTQTHVTASHLKVNPHFKIRTVKKSNTCIIMMYAEHDVNNRPHNSLMNS